MRRNWRRATFETRLALANRLSQRIGIASESDSGGERIVSLTTTRCRLRTVYLTVESLLLQNTKPHRVILWLAEEMASEPLPPHLQRQKERGLEVRFRLDVGPATKLIHALREHPEATIVTADDDTLYPPTWLGELAESCHRLPTTIHCHRAHWICSKADGALEPYNSWKRLDPGQVGPAHRLFPTGVGGVLYPPNSLHPEVLNESLFLQLCPTADDVWFKAMALLREVPARKIRPVCDGFPTIRSGKRNGLSLTNSQHANYDRQIRAVFEHYGVAKTLEEPV